ncbi:Uncharacterised protein [Ectopseudomonas oleovorans]|uniref:EpsG family protein n=1 Tax=Ectopseudomonas oleovorans TaxID=301 RepID=A0A379K6J2_ECTOL|nr:EpsG family protein [Pseudomonas oleovorans]SUD59721.1 Uncharacterised protein [Pseudomonas oleovorans]
MTVRTLDKSSRQLDLFFSFSIFFLAWILYATNTWNGDWDAYEIYYYERDIRDWGFEIGYGFLNIAFRSLGFSYQWFVVFIATLSIFFIFRYVIKFSGIKSLFAVIYFLSFFALDYVLMRNTLAFAVFLYGFKLLMLPGFVNRFLYLFFVLIASTLHQSMLVFMLFVFSPVSHVFKKSTFVILFLFALISYVFIFPHVVRMLGFSGHLGLYGEFNLTGYLVAVFMSLIPVCSILYLDCLSKKTISVSGDFAYRYRVVVLNMNLLSLFFVFLYFESPIFVRLFRYIAFLNLVYISWLCLIHIKRSPEYLVVALFYVVFLFLYFINPYLEYTVFPLFFNNYFTGAFR